MSRNYMEVQVAASVDSGELLGMLPEEESLGAWEADGIIHLFWPEECWNPDAQLNLKLALCQLGADADLVNLSASLVPDQDWNARWAESVQPIQIGKRVLIRQSWNSALPPPGGFELVIDPKRAFGTGYHATTRLLVSWLEDSLRSGAQVLDIGTGSGILAMTALRLGATLAVAIDIDAVAIECARENAEVNGFGAELQLRVASLEDLGKESFDLTVANLDRRTILALADKFSANLHPEGRLLVSGLQIEDESDIAEVLARAGGEIAARRECDEWLALEVQFKEQTVK